MLFPQEWDEILIQRFSAYNCLTSKEKSELKLKILFFLENKNFVPVGEFEITTEMKLLIAAQACLLIVNLGRKVFPELKNIYITSETFISKDNSVNLLTGLPKFSPELGEHMHRGPIILSWAAVESGLLGIHAQNVVYHEFAHNLDQQDGGFDGTPPLFSSGAYKRWALVMTKEFHLHKTNILKNHSHDIDDYGAKNEAEFFAVLTEYFFNRPKFLEKKHPDLYLVFKDYFKLDPANWDC